VRSVISLGRFWRIRVVEPPPAGRRLVKREGRNKSRTQSSSSRLALFLITLTGSLVLHGGIARAQEVSWVPIGADGPFVFGTSVDGAGQPTEIILLQGVVYNRIELEVRVNGWGDAPGAPRLGELTAFLDGSGLLGANANPPNPGVDLAILDEAPYGIEAGVFTTFRTCLGFDLTNTGQRCDPLAPPLPPCPVLTFCGDNPDFIFVGRTASSAVFTSDAPDVGWGLASNAGNCKTDDGISSYYVGTLILTEPTGSAAGTYSLGFLTTSSPPDVPARLSGFSHSKRIADRRAGDLHGGVLPAGRYVRAAIGV